MPQKLEIVTCHVKMYTTLNVLMASCFQQTKLLEQPDVFNDQADVSSKRVTKQF